jgi:hypothetical protein
VGDTTSQSYLAQEPRSPRLKTLVVLSLSILTDGAGNLSLSYGMKSVGPPEAWTSPGLRDVVGTALSSAPVIAGGQLTSRQPDRAFE